MTGEEATMMYRLMGLWCNVCLALMSRQLAHERRAYEECRQRLASKVH